MEGIAEQLGLGSREQDRAQPVTLPREEQRGMLRFGRWPAGAR
jgi:hypothetical protein